jgi:drug/metabolite transporter (DMT)-like permease
MFDLGNTNLLSFPQPIVLKIVYILFFTSFLVYLLNAYAVKKAGPTLAGIYIYLQPVLAAIIALIMGTDHLTNTRIVQIVVIMISVWSATRFSPSSSNH